MKLELQENMYIRTNDGKITKFIKYDEKDKNELVTEYYKYSTIWIKDVVKASFDLIDILEQGDYVNGMKVLEIDEEKDLYCDSEYYCGSFDKDEIYSIVTKEQFESMSYKVD